MTGLVVVFAILFGAEYVSPIRGIARPTAGPMLDHFRNWDGVSYLLIATDGYPRDLDRRKEWAFFPGYPLLIRAVVAVTRISPSLAGVLISNGCLLLCCGLFHHYAAQRLGKSGALAAVTALMCWPPGFFFRVAYSESLFLTGVLVVMTGMRQRWHPLLIAGVIGACTGIRPVGLALVPAFAAHLFGRWRHASPTRPLWVRAGQASGLLLASVWGLAGYAGFQYAVLGSPTAFAEVQSTDYRMRPVIPWRQKAVKLITFEPIRAAYDDTAGTGEHWSRVGGFEMEGNPVLTFRFWNPVFLLGAVGLVTWGGARRWLDGPEVVLGLGLLAVPYYTRAYEFSMCSQGRFTDVCVPAFLVLGRLGAALPEGCRLAVAVAAAGLMAAFAAQFSAGYPVF